MPITHSGARGAGWPGAPRRRRWEWRDEDRSEPSAPKGVGKQRILQLVIEPRFPQCFGAGWTWQIDDLHVDLLGLRTRWASEKQFKDDSWEWSAPGGSLAWDATGDAMRMGVLRRETMPSDKSRFVLRIDTTEVENALAAMSEVTTASVTVGGTGKLIVDPCLSGRRFEQSIRLFATTITR